MQTYMLSLLLESTLGSLVGEFVIHPQLTHQR